MTTKDLFEDAYAREEIAYGLTPSAALSAAISQFADVNQNDAGPFHALDLGAGAGRDTLELAGAGYDVDSVDLSPEGTRRIDQRAVERELQNLIHTHVADAREFDIATRHYDFIAATTVLDHIPADDALGLFHKMVDGLTDRGVMFVEVHSTSDPGCRIDPGCDSDAPVSETANAVINYFAPNQLAKWVIDSNRLRILQYEERLEWDYTHGPEHQHAKAIVLAVRSGFFPSWYGQPPAFPKQPS